ncbi:MAG: 50S ribosomal protein L22, partial [Geobacteraceae bacterium]
QKAAAIVSTLVTSAVANAEQKGVSDLDRLFIKEIMVDQGPVLKRFLPRAQGRATKIRKPTSHILVVLAEK